jgi:hypothetical protein
VISVFAPHERYAESSDAESRALRAELTISGEAMAAFQVADSVQVKSFGFDETTKYHDSVLSSNTQILRRDGKVVDVVLRGAFLIPGGTAKEVAEAVDQKLMRHGRRLLQQWKDEHEALHGLGSWERDGGASPEGIGMHRLSEHTLLMSDTCNAARCAKRLLGTMAIDAAVERIGKDRWEAMGEVERGEKCANYQGDCYQHLRNILIGALSDGATNHLKDELADSLEDFSSFDRMSTDAMDLIRAIYKELHKVCSSTVQYSTVQYSTVQYSTVQYSTVLLPYHPTQGGEYALGKGREFHAWLCKHHPSAVWMPLERAGGGRQDLPLDGAVPIFLNRKLILQFLYPLISVPGSSNKLEKFLWRTLRYCS